MIFPLIRICLLTLHYAITKKSESVLRLPTLFININSQSGVEVEEFCPIYNASKHGSYAYRKAIQRDLAKHNIKITDVCPGLIKTNFYIRANDKLPDEIMCLGLEAEDVAKTVLYVMNLPHEITIPF